MIKTIAVKSPKWLEDEEVDKCLTASGRPEEPRGAEQPEIPGAQPFFFERNGGADA
nr:MAG TPA_asm: hypothetical protein [Caudoviricetes sp.]